MRLVLLLALIAAGSSSTLPPCKTLQAGITVNGTEAIQFGVGKNFDPGYVFGAHSQPNGTFYFSLVSGPPQPYTVTLYVMPDNSVDKANCTPVIEPSSGTLSTTVTPIVVTYNCVSVGRCRIFLSIQLSGACESSTYWNKFSGTALVVATSPSLFSSPDVASFGVPLGPWAAPLTVFPFNDTNPAVFYVSISPKFSKTVQPKGIPILLAVPSSLSLSPSLSPNGSIPYTPTDPATLTVSFFCTNSEDGGAVTVTIPCEPFAPTVFQFFKQCHNAPAVFVNSVDANGGVVSKVVSDGDLLDQSWNPTNPAQLFTYSQNVTSLQAVVSNDTFVYGYRMGPTTVTATNAFVPGGPVCGHTVSGQLSYADDTLAGTPANMSVSYQCGDTNGFTQFIATVSALNISLGLNPVTSSSPISMSWLKTCGYAPGFNVTAFTYSQAQNNTVVVANGMTAPGWFAPPTVLPFESNENCTFLAVDTEFIRFAFTQASPFPNVTLNGQMQPTITDYNGTSNPTNIVLSGVLAGAVPTVGNVTSFLDVDIYPKFNTPYVGVSISPQLFNFYVPSFGFFTRTVLNPDLQVNCVTLPGNPVVMSGGQVLPTWSSASYVARPINKLEFAISHITSDAAPSYLGQPYYRVNISSVCAVNVSFVDNSAPAVVDLTHQVSIIVSFHCLPRIGDIALTVVIPLVSSSGEALATPYKFGFVFQTDLNPPGPPGVVPELQLSPMLPADNTTRVGIATLSFSKPQTYFDDVLQYTVRTFDLTVNNSSVYNETGYPAPVDDELQLTFPDYTHEYGVQIAAITIDGYGPYGSTVTTVWSASPTASVSVSVAPSVSPSPSRVPPELIKKRRLNEIIMGLSFTVAGLALCVALAVVFMEWRRRVAEEEAKRPKPLPVSAVIELEPEVSGATAPSINRVKSGGSTRGPASVRSGKSGRSSTKSRSRRVKLQNSRKTEKFLAEAAERLLAGEEDEEEEGGAGDSFISDGGSTRSAGATSSLPGSPGGVLLTGVAQPRPKPSARMHKLGGEARASPLLFTVEESPAARPSDADLLVGDGMLPVHTGTSSVQ